MASPRTAAELLDLIEQLLVTALQLSDGFEREKALALIQLAAEGEGALDKLHDIAKDLKDLAGKRPEDLEKDLKFKGVPRKLSEIVSGAGGRLENRDRLGLSSFFHDIAQSYREAQEELNAESLDYARNVPAGIPPAHFAIPSVKAEMEVGFETRSDRKVNVVFFGKTFSREQYGHSKISFEVVSAPPPPGGRVEGIPPFFAVGHERNSVLAALRDGAVAAGIPSDFTFETASILVLRIRRSVYTDETAYLVVAIDEAGGDRDRRRSAGAYIVRDRQGAYRLSREVFSSKNLAEGQAVFVPSKNELRAFQAADLKKLEMNLGDLLVTFSVALHGWISEGGTRYPGFLSPIDERRDVLDAVYEDDRIKRIKELGGSGTYDLVLRRRVADGWAATRLVILRGNKREATDWRELVALSVRKVDGNWTIDPGFLGGDTLLHLDAPDAGDEARRVNIANVPDVLLEVKAAATAWMEFLGSGNLPPA
jgi:hypothetical protein